MEYCIGENFWGKGYAGEALNAILEHIFENTGFNKIEAFHRVENEKSGQVLKKSLMQITENVERFIRQDKLPHGEICYAITREFYFANKQ